MLRNALLGAAALLVTFGKCLFTIALRGPGDPRDQSSFPQGSFGPAGRLDSVYGAPGRSRRRAVGREHRRLIRQCPRRIRDRSLQDGGHLEARPLAWNRRRRVCDAGVGVVVQHEEDPGADREHPACRAGGALLSKPEVSRGSSDSQLTRPPGKPGWFTPHEEAQPARLPQPHLAATDGLPAAIGRHLHGPLP